MTDSSNTIRVGIADMNVVKPPFIIRTAGLGSCVGVVLFDSVVDIGGLVHIMLPDSEVAKDGQLNMAKYADTGVRVLAERVIKHGARASNLKAKIAGGAQMFQFSVGSDLMRIGPRNVAAVKKALLELQIELLAEDCGGNNGRTIEFNPISKVVTIKTVNQGVKSI